MHKISTHLKSHIMKKLIVIIALFCVSITSTFAKMNVEYSWKNDSVFAHISVQVSGPEVRNSFSFPCSLEGYVQTLLPFLKESVNQEEIAYKLQTEYTHYVQTSLNNAEASSTKWSFIAFIGAIVFSIISLLRPKKIR